MSEMNGTRLECINGTVRGTLDNGIASFKGIPYTKKPPIGKNRWMPPVPFDIEDRFIDAQSFAPAPPQISKGRFATSEDCLYLNVWNNTNDPSRDKPVIFWIHGGTYTSGSTSHPLYDGENFVKDSPDVIFVSAGYRLGALGFMDVSGVPGGEELVDSPNLGMLDLGVALRWVHDNISFFGGDPDNITVMGQSAGAACASLLASGESGKYVRRVIAESGSPTFSTDGRGSSAVGKFVARSFGCTDIKEMRSIPAEKLGELSGDLSMKVWPVRDGRTVPKDPYAELKKRKTDVLAGSNLNEMAVFISSMGKDALIETTKKTLSMLPEKGRAMAMDYLGEGDETEAYMNLANGTLFSGPAELLATNAASSGAKGYRYLWTVPSGYPGYGASHGAEVPAVLRNLPSEQYNDISLKAHRMWASFARDGIPSEDWPVCDEEDRPFMVIGEAGFKVCREPLPDLVRGLEGAYLF